MAEISKMHLSLFKYRRRQALYFRRQYSLRGLYYRHSSIWASKCVDINPSYIRMRSLCLSCAAEKRRMEVEGFSVVVQRLVRGGTDIAMDAMPADRCAFVTNMLVTNAQLSPTGTGCSKIAERRQKGVRSIVMVVG